jgi:hypothetical protein
MGAVHSDRLPTASLELAADFSSVAAQAPVYVTLMTLALTTVLPTSFLYFNFTSNWIHRGAFAGNAAVNFRFDLNAGLLTGGTTDNNVRSQIGNVARNRRVAVTAGVQTLIVEVTKFGAVGNTLDIDVVTLPDLFHSALFMEEQV